MLRNKLEALLFSSGRKMSVEELSKLSNTKAYEVQVALEELKKDYDEKNSSVMLINEGDSWKLTVREQFLPLVQKIVTETELSKTIMETLAVIAFKYPIKQSDLIKIRTNKAYDHLKELEEMGYITRQKHGRTNLIKLTQKFFDYFDLPKEKLKEVFDDFASIAKAIEDKEKEVEAIKQEQKALAKGKEQKDENIKKEIDLVDEEEPDKEDEETQKLEEEDQKVNEADEQSLEEELKFEGSGIKVTKEMEKIIDEKVDKLLHPPKGEEEEGREEQKTEKKEVKEEIKAEAEEEPKDLIEAEMEEINKEKKQ